MTAEQYFSFPMLAQTTTPAAPPAAPAAPAAPGAPGSSPSGPQPGALDMLFPIAIFIILFYMLILRPQAKKQKDAKALMSSLKKGDQVITIGGVHGVITNVQENTVTVKVDDNVKIKFQRTAIDQIVKPSAEPAAETAVAAEKA